MRWYEYKMEVDDLRASDDLKARLMALQDGAADLPGASPAARPERKKAVRFPLRRAAGLAACLAVGAVCFGAAALTGLPVGLGMAGAGSASSASYSSYALAAPEAAGAALDSVNGSDGAAARTASVQESKILYTATLELETKTYDETRAALEAALTGAGGYAESYSESSRSERARSLTLTARVPEETYEAFLTAAAETGNLVNRSERAEDVTASYMDVAARLEQMEARRTRLLELQAQAGTLADLLEIEASLSEVQYEIESWQQQLNWYDDQVESCTVTIYLNEVKTYTPSQESFAGRLAGAFGEGWSAFLEGGQDLLVFLASAWPVVGILAAAVGGFFGWRRVRRWKRGG